MRRNGLVLFIAVAAVVLMTAGNVFAAADKLHYNESYEDKIVCTRVLGEVQCNTEAVESAVLVGSLFVGEFFVEEILAAPELAGIAGLLQGTDLLGSAEFELLLEDFGAGDPKKTCFLPGTRTCRGVFEDEVLGVKYTLNMRATSDALLFTLTADVADMIFNSIIDASTPISENVLGEIEVFSYNGSEFFEFEIPTPPKTSIGVAALVTNVTAPDDQPFDLLKARFRVQGPVIFGALNGVTE